MFSTIAGLLVGSGVPLLLESLPVVGLSPLQAGAVLAHVYPLTRREGLAVVMAADDVGTPWWALAVLIDFESAGTWDPSVRNPDSGAVGLIQFTGTTLRRLGVTPTQAARMSVIEQLQLVVRYLEEVKDGAHPDDPTPGPLDTLQRLAMAVFYPPAREWAPVHPMPARVTRHNASILTPAHYTRRLWTRIPPEIRRWVK